MADPVHVVLGWSCKSKGCEEFHAIAHLGEKEKVTGYKLNLTGMGKGLSVPCPRCGRTHFYRTRDARTVEINSAPPPGTPPSVI
jgi:predicted RNA-binding Zn-ribbon protein involved in translation (DUF1610 family)